MLAYAANRPVAGNRESSPNILLLVISAHVALLAAVMSAKMDLPARLWHAPPLISVPIPPVPPPSPPQHPRHQPTTNESFQTIRQVVHAPSAKPSIELPVDHGQTAVDQVPTSIAGDGQEPIPLKPAVQPDPFRSASLLTAPSDLRPPYPASKLASEEEATLHLQLTIDAQGNVTEVVPVGYADREFLGSARRYIIAHWHYRPASRDGHPITSVLVVTLRFQLDG